MDFWQQGVFHTVTKTHTWLPLHASLHAITQVPHCQRQSNRLPLSEPILLRRVQLEPLGALMEALSHWLLGNVEHSQIHTNICKQTHIPRHRKCCMQLVPKSYFQEGFGFFSCTNAELHHTNAHKFTYRYLPFSFLVIYWRKALMGKHTFTNVRVKSGSMIHYLFLFISLIRKWTVFQHVI